MWTPDDLDIRIIRALASPHSFQWDVRISYAHIAGGLKVDEETVRNRLKRMNDAQFLQGWQLILNPVLLGREAAIVELRVAETESKREVIAQLKLIEGVMLVDDFYGRELAVLTLYESAAGLERQVELCASLCRCPTPISWRLGFPPCEIMPTKTDWRIIQALRKTGRARLSDVASSLGLSTRTVKRRLISLVESNAFYLDPVLDLSKVGGVRCRFWVTSEMSRKHAIDKAIVAGLPRIISTHTAPEEHSLFIAHLSNASEIHDILQWMKKISGVIEVRSAIEVEHIHVQDWLEGEIHRRLTAPASAQRA
jgi:DNA-binding Lrp family transcriptional regulator